MNGKGREGRYESVDLNGIFCDLTCPMPGMNCTKEAFLRRWSNNAWEDLPAVKNDLMGDWEFGVPTTNSHVYIPCEWSVKIDLNFLE